MYFIVLYFVVLHGIVLYLMYCMVLHGIAWHCIVLYCSKKAPQLGDFGQICPDFDPPSNLLPPRFIVTLNYLLRPTDTATGNKTKQEKIQIFQNMQNIRKKERVRRNNLNCPIRLQKKECSSGLKVKQVFWGSTIVYKTQPAKTNCKIKSIFEVVATQKLNFFWTNYETAKIPVL